MTMPMFEVTTALTVYTTYTVKAPDRDAARARIAMPDSRAEFPPSRFEGDDDDEEVIGVREVMG